MSSKWQLSGMSKDALPATTQALQGGCADPMPLGHSRVQGVILTPPGHKAGLSSEPCTAGPQLGWAR